MKNKFGKETETYLNHATGINTKITIKSLLKEITQELNILNGNQKWNKQYYAGQIFLSLKINNYGKIK